MLENYEFNVLENAVIGQLIGTLNAYDLDFDEILFSISDNQHIQIDSSTGQLTIKSLFDYEGEVFI